MRKRTLMVTLIVVISLITANLSAQMRDRGRMMHRDGDFRHHHGMCYGDPQHMRMNLKLTDKQIEQIGKINLKFRNILIEYRERLVPKRNMLRKFLLSDKINFNDVRTLLREISDIEIEMRIIKIKHRLEIEKVLTKTQRDRLRKERTLNWN
jgi:Spy/CpxP family protein refolding chaperone